MCDTGESKADPTDLVNVPNTSGEVSLCDDVSNLNLEKNKSDPEEVVEDQNEETDSLSDARYIFYAYFFSK